MRSSQICTLAFVFLAVPGCGTCCNLNDPPTGTQFCGTGTCYPFGGVTRSVLFALMGPPAGLSSVFDGSDGGLVTVLKGDVGPGFEKIGEGLELTGGGLLAIADVPLSLLGDIATYPLAYARSKEYP